MKRPTPTDPKKTPFRRPLETLQRAHEDAFSSASAQRNIPVNARGEKGIDLTTVGDPLPKDDPDWREKLLLRIAA
jgi:hypothetical protein